MVRAASLACKTLTGRQSPGVSRAAPSLLGRMANPFKRKALAVLPVLILSVAVVPGEARSEIYSPGWCAVGSGSWFEGTCWSFYHPPYDGGNADLEATSGGYTVNYDRSVQTSLGELFVGNVQPGYVTLKISDPGASLGANFINVSAGAFGVGQANMIQETGGVGAGLSPGTTGETGLWLGSATGTTGSYLLSGGTLATSNTMIGSTGSGTFTHNGTLGSSVTHQTGALTLGRLGGSYGTYNLGAGQLTSSELVVGHQGTGEFVQSAPLNSYNTTGSLTVGKSSGSVGTYTMQGGWLFADRETIGDYGSGTFTHWGGLNDVTGYLVVGQFHRGAGTYSMQGMFGGNPELRARDVIVGWYGTGSFEQYGGIHTVATGLKLGFNGGSSGSYLLDGDGALNTGFTVVGVYGDGAFTQHTGSHTVGDGLYVGSLSTGRGVYNLYGGSLAAASIVVGNEGTGWFTQTGGSNTTGNLIIGYGAASFGTYTLDGWQNLDAGTVTVGNRGVATFTQNYGTVNVGTSIVIGAGAGSVGTYNLNGGAQLNAANITVGMDGTGVFNQTDGQNRYNYVPGVVASLNVGTGSGNGTYNLSGGWVETDNINLGTGTGSGTFNHTGGDVTAYRTLTIGAHGSYNMSSGGSRAPNLRAQTAIVNNGTINFNAGSISAGFNCSYCGEGPFPTEILNNGTFNIGGAGERQLSGVTVNNGTMKITDTTVRFSRDFLNNGAYISDPSTNIFTSLMVSETGYLVGGAGDSFQIWNDFYSYSTRADLWDTAEATLSFHGWQTHEFYLGGWDAASSRSFSWGTLELNGSGDLFFSGDPGVALYVDNLILGSGTTLNLNGFNLYYTTLTDNGGSFSGGQLIQWAGNPGGGGVPAVPEPETYAMLLAGLGLLGFAARRRGRGA